MVSGIQTAKKLSQKARSLVKKRQTSDTDVSTLISSIIGTIGLWLYSNYGIKIEPGTGNISAQLADIQSTVDDIYKNLTAEQQSELSSIKSEIKDAVET